MHATRWSSICSGVWAAGETADPLDWSEDTASQFDATGVLYEHLRPRAWARTSDLALAVAGGGGPPASSSPPQRQLRRRQQATERARRPQRGPHRRTRRPTPLHYPNTLRWNTRTSTGRIIHAPRPRPRTTPREQRRGTAPASVPVEERRGDGQGEQRDQGTRHYQQREAQARNEMEEEKKRSRALHDQVLQLRQDLAQQQEEAEADRRRLHEDIKIAVDKVADANRIIKERDDHITNIVKELIAFQSKESDYLEEEDRLQRQLRRVHDDNEKTKELLRTEKVKLLRAEREVQDLQRRLRGCQELLRGEREAREKKKEEAPKEKTLAESVGEVQQAVKTDIVSNIEKMFADFHQELDQWQRPEPRRGGRKKKK